MKKINLLFATAAIMAGTLLVSCEKPAEKVQDAKSEVTDAKEDLRDAEKDLAKAQEEYLRDVEMYRKENADKITKNEQAIADLKKQTEIQKAEVKAAYNKEIVELEEKNNRMKLKLAEYKADGRDQWGTFKTEFNNDIDGMGKSLQDFAARNRAK